MLFALAVILLLDQCLASNPWTPEPAVVSWTNWTKRHEDMLTQTQQHGKDAQIVFIGDSITEGWTWDQKSRDIWEKHYTPRHAYNYGIGGDRTEHVLWRIEHKEFDGMNPKVAVVMIGTNNLWRDSIDDITHGVREILNQLNGKMPMTKVILLGILPRAEPDGSKGKQLNVLLKKLADEKTVFWLDMWAEFESSDGKMKNDLYLPDHLHINPSGYDVWQKTMEPLLSKFVPAY